MTAKICPRGTEKIGNKCYPLKVYFLQARQFGKTLDSGYTIAGTREKAIDKFKEQHYISHGYVIHAQKIRDFEPLKKGDKVKIAVPFEGYKEYGLRKGSKGIIVKKTVFREQPAYQVDFESAGKELSLFPFEIEKI